MDAEILIRVEGLKKSFQGKEVLRGVDLSIREGEVFIVLGRSGVGKSVLLKNMVGLMRPEAGRVIYRGKDLVRAEPEEWKEVRREFAVVFQHSALFDSLSVGENVAFGLRRMTRLSEEEIRERVKESLSLVGLEGIEEARISQLSGGMQKRVAIARAIALRPRVIFYDEPTTGLDPIMAATIAMLILKMKREIGSTSFIITHDLKLAFRVGTTLAMLHDGRIVFMGTPEQFRECSNPVVKKFVEGIPD